VVLTGRNSKAKKAFTGTGTAGSAKWGGEGDEGAFAAGETVDFVLESPTVPAYHASRAKGNLFITALKAEAFRADDIVVDDFDDGDSLNALKGAWSVFTDKAAKGTSYVNPAAFGPAIFSVGDDKTKAVSVRIVGAAGAPKPYAGIRAAFAATGGTVGLGAARSVVFDVKSSKGSMFWVELEQPDIADGAYHGFQVAIGTDSWNRIRVPLSAFTQPAWKTAARPFNPGAVSALRFTYYGEGTVRFDLDNVRMEGMKIGPAGIRALARPFRKALHSRVAGGAVRYPVPSESVAPVFTDTRGRLTR